MRMTSGKPKFIYLNKNNLPWKKPRQLTIFRFFWYEVTLAANDDDWGSVEGAGEYVEGDEITITATPAEGYVFVEWTGDIAHIEDPTEATTTLTVPAAAVSLTAVFELAP